MSLPFGMDAIVNLFLSDDLIVYRYTEKYRKGIVQKAVQRFKCKASCQPIRGEELQRPPQAMDDGEWISVWSPFRFELKDELIFRDNHYQVEKLNEWQENGKYTSVICSRLHKTEIGPDWIDLPGIASTSAVGTPDSFTTT